MHDDERLLRLKDVQEVIPFSRAKIYELIRKRKFPKPLKVGGSSLWKSSEIQKYISDLG